MARTLHYLALALCMHGAWACAAELSGSIYSSTGTLPAGIEILADPAKSQTPITGTVERGRYRITLPATGLFRLRLVAKDWSAPPKYIAGPVSAGALDFLIYPAQLPEPTLAQELLLMGKLDQEARKRPPALEDKERDARLKSGDLAREARLASIIDEKGWPLISQVGHEAARGAWLVAQHGTPAFLERCLVLMQAAADKHEMNLAHLAWSIDRVLVDQGKPQRYGSQFEVSEAGTTAYPIEDMAHLNERRASMGLEPLNAHPQ